MRIANITVNTTKNLKSAYPSGQKSFGFGFVQQESKEKAIPCRVCSNIKRMIRGLSQMGWPNAAKAIVWLTQCTTPSIGSTTAQESVHCGNMASMFFPIRTLKARVRSGNAGVSLFSNALTCRLLFNTMSIPFRFPTIEYAWHILEFMVF
jgi:hypothetical protein